jgi:hypothetical protein
MGFTLEDNEMRTINVGDTITIGNVEYTVTTLHPDGLTYGVRDKPENREQWVDICQIKNVKKI